MNNLFLHEELMLLALRDKKGTVEFGTNYSHAIGAAILAELLLDQRISIEVVKRSKLVNVTSGKPLGDPLIDECLDSIKHAKRRAKLETWVARFAGIRRLKNRVAETLCRRRILREDEDKVLLIFSRKIYPEINPKPERELIERLRKAIFTDTRSVEPRTVVLLSLANSGSLLKTAFDKKKLRQRKKRIDQIVNGEITGKAAQDAIQAMQAAVMVCCIMPAITTTIITSS